MFVHPPLVNNLFLLALARVLKLLELALQLRQRLLRLEQLLLEGPLLGLQSVVLGSKLGNLADRVVTFAFHALKSEMKFKGMSLFCP